MMDKPVDRCDRNRMIGEDTIPGSEGLVGHNGSVGSLNILFDFGLDFPD